LYDSIDDPLTAEFKAFAGKWILAAEKGAANSV
jgi:hypothetical protein